MRKINKIIVQPIGNHTNVEGLIGKTVEAVLPGSEGGLNIRFKGKGGREPFLEIGKGRFTNGKNINYIIGEYLLEDK